MKYLDNFGKKELIGMAIKSEIESERIYSQLANRVKNAFLKDKLLFLSSEENGHKRFLESTFSDILGNGEVHMPQGVEVPLPSITIDSENDPVSYILEECVKAEENARVFYESISELFVDEGIKNMLEILARMEYSHQLILENELENAKRFEDYDTEWPMMHVGP